MRVKAGVKPGRRAGKILVWLFKRLVVMVAGLLFSTGPAAPRGPRSRLASPPQSLVFQRWSSPTPNLKDDE